MVFKVVTERVFKYSHYIRAEDAEEAKQTALPLCEDDYLIDSYLYDATAYVVNEEDVEVDG